MENIKISFLGVWMTGDVGETVSFIIELPNNKKILVDSGINTVSALKKLGINIEDITHIICTHKHGDHISGIPMFLFYKLKYLKIIENIAPTKLLFLGQQETLNAISEYCNIAYNHIMEDDYIEQLYLTDMQEYKIDNYIFTFFKSNHNPTTIGFKLYDSISKKTIVYSSDTSLSSNIFEISKNADILIHDVVATSKYRKLSKMGHSICDEVATECENYHIKSLVPVHRLTKYYKNEQDYLKEIQNNYNGNVYLVYDGDTITL